MAIEILNIALRNNPNIPQVVISDGIFISTEIYADNLSIILPRSEEAINEALKTINRFKLYMDP